MSATWDDRKTVGRGVGKPPSLRLVPAAEIADRVQALGPEHPGLRRLFTEADETHPPPHVVKVLARKILRAAK